MAAPKCRLDVWQPTILTVLASGATSTAQRPAMWVKCDTVTDVTTGNSNPNLRRANACTAVEIKDEMFSPRIAYISVANRPQDFTAFDADTLETQHQDSDGNSILIGGSAAKTRIRRNWGPFSYFFKEFQEIRLVDLETHLVLFTGRIYKVSKKHDGQRGATVEIVCKDALEELKNISMNTMPKELHFGTGARRSTVVQSLLNLAFNYEASLPSGGINKNQTSPVSTVLSSANYSINSNDASSSDAANSYSRFERSATSNTDAIKLKPRKTGSKHLLSELTRWAILEPHENETAENQFGYDFFIDANIGSNNLLATTAPPPAMFNYFKRGNRLSADADTYGLTCILPTVARATHSGLLQEDVGTTAASGTSSVELFAINLDHSLYAGQVITIGSEQMYVRFVVNSNDEGGEEEVSVLRGWLGSPAASFSSGATIKESRTAKAVIQKDTSSFDDTKDELFTECALTYETSYLIGAGTGTKLGVREKTKRFEIMFVSEISGNFIWSGLDFDNEGKGEGDEVSGENSAELISAYRENGTTLIASAVAKIQYQSATSITGSTNFAYILLSDIAMNFPIINYSGESYVVLKGVTSGNTCKLNLAATEVQTGRPSQAFAGGTGSFRRVFPMTTKVHENIDDIRQEIAARLGQSTIAMKRGDFSVSKAPYYWADFQVLSATNDGSTGQIITVKNKNGSTAVSVTDYGFREGMLVHKRTGTSDDYWAKIAVDSTNSKDLYGYCYNMTSDTTFYVNLTESNSFAANDYIRLFIPIRAGDAMFVDHILANVYGEHLVTAVNFNEMPVPTTSYSTIGENETRIRMRVGSVNKQNIWNSIAVDRLEATERERRNIPKGIQAFSFSGTWSYPANNKVAWTLGNLRIADGEVYQIAADDTSDATYGLNGDMASGTKYVVYLDTEGENPSGNIYHFYTKSAADYVADEDKIIVLETSVGTVATKANAIAGSNLDLSQTDIPKAEASRVLQPGTVAGDLIVSGALDAHTITLTGSDGKLRTSTGVNKVGSATATGSGVIINNSGIYGVSSGIHEFELMTDGKAYFGGGTASLSAAGLTIVNGLFTIKTSTASATGERMEITSTGIKAFDANNNELTDISTTGKTTITEGIFRTSAINKTGTGSSDWTLSNAGVYIDSDGVFGSATGNTHADLQFYLSAADGKGYFGAGACTLDDRGIKLGQLGSGSDDDFLNFYSQVSSSNAYFRMQSYQDALFCFFFGSNNTHNFSPGAATAYGNLGNDGYRWRKIYCGPESGSAPTSDGLYISGILLRNNAGTLEWNNVAVGGGVTSVTAANSITVSSSTGSVTIGHNSTPGAGHQHVLGYGTGSGSAEEGQVMTISSGGHLIWADQTGSGGGGGGVSLSSANTWTATQTFNPSSGLSVIARSTMQMDAGSWIKSVSAPSGTSGYVRLYAKGSGTASSLYFKDGGGNEFDLSTGAGGGTHPDPHRMNDGTISAPTYSFSGNTDSGMFYDTTNTGPAITHDNSWKQTWSANASIVNTSLWPNSSTSSRYLGKTSQFWARLYVGTSTWVNSDAENKENLTPISNGLEFISRLSPITFNRKEESDIYFGFTAQEMKQAVLDSGYSEKLEVYSEELDAETGETHWGIAYETLVAPLVAAVKELKDRIEVLEGN